MITNDLFYNEELKQLPLTYYKMDKIHTKELKELHIHDVFTKSILHQSEYYRKVTPIIPFSNFIITHEE